MIKITPRSETILNDQRMIKRFTIILSLLYNCYINDKSEYLIEIMSFGNRMFLDRFFDLKSNLPNVSTIFFIIFCKTKLNIIQLRESKEIGRKNK